MRGETSNGLRSIEAGPAEGIPLGADAESPGMRRRVAAVSAATVLALVGASLIGPAAFASIPASASAPDSASVPASISLRAAAFRETTVVAQPPVALPSPPAVSTSSEFDAPSGLAVVGSHLWVTNQAGNSLSEIDTDGGGLIVTIHGAGYGFNQPTAIAASGADLFVANGAGFVSEVLASTGALVRTISGPQFGFDDPVAVDAFSSSIILVLSAGSPSAKPPVPGSVAEIDAATGALLRRVAPASFVDPVALTSWGADVFVADQGKNAVTEFSPASGAIVRKIQGQGLSGPDGIAVGDGHVWVSDSETNATTEIDAATGTVLQTITKSKYGFAAPSVAIASGGNVFIASPFGVSPMVTQLAASTGDLGWYMCNTNGPYYFSLISAFAVANGHLWVANRSGANYKKAPNTTGSLTEMDASSGALIGTFTSS